LRAVRRTLALALLLAVAGCSRSAVVIEPEEIDVCPVLADQLENLLVTIVDFAEEATTEELLADEGTAAELRRRGIELSERATALGCDPVELRSRISTSGLKSDDPVAARFIELVLESL
jgi:hypothetical protein